MGKGGKGGSAAVYGHGAAIGGPGGHSGNLPGIGGDGGSGFVNGDGASAGGEGGSVDGEFEWFPPARSGYEVHQRALNLPVDPVLRQYGRGGMSAGYAEKLAVVQNLRTAFFVTTSAPVRSIDEDIAAVPIAYLNSKLAELGLHWRAKVVQGDYWFFVPRYLRRTWF